MGVFKKKKKTLIHLDKLVLANEQGVPFVRGGENLAGARSLDMYSRWMRGRTWDEMR